MNSLVTQNESTPTNAKALAALTTSPVRLSGLETPPEHTVRHALLGPRPGTSMHWGFPRPVARLPRPVRPAPPRTPLHCQSVMARRPHSWPLPASTPAAAPGPPTSPHAMFSGQKSLSDWWRVVFVGRPCFRRLGMYRTASFVKCEKGPSPPCGARCERKGYGTAPPRREGTRQLGSPTACLAS